MDKSKILNSSKKVGGVMKPITQKPVFRKKPKKGKAKVKKVVGSVSIPPVKSASPKYTNVKNAVKLVSNKKGGKTIIRKRNERLKIQKAPLWKPFGI